MRLNLRLLFYPNIHWKLHSRAKLLEEEQQIWRPNQVLDQVTMAMKWHFSFFKLHARAFFGLFCFVFLPSWIYFLHHFPLVPFQSECKVSLLYDFFFSSSFAYNVLLAVKENENDVWKFRSQGYDLNHTFKHPEILHFPAQSLNIFNKYVPLFMILNVNSICMYASVCRYSHTFHYINYTLCR